MRLYTTSAQGNSQSNLDHLENSSIGSLSLEYCGVQTPESSPHGSPFNNPMINDSVLRSTRIIEQYRCGSANLGDNNNVPQNGLINSQQSVAAGGGGVNNGNNNAVVDTCDSNRTSSSSSLIANLTGYTVDNYKSSLTGESNSLQNSTLNTNNGNNSNGDMDNHGSNYVAISTLNSSTSLLDPAHSLPTPEMSPVENNDKVSDQVNLQQQQQHQHHHHFNHPYHRVPSGGPKTASPGGGGGVGNGNEALSANRQLYRLIQSNPRTSTVDSQANQTTVYS